MLEAGELTLNVRNVPLADVLKMIGQHAGFDVVIKGNANAPITLVANAQPVADVVRQITRDLGTVMIYATPKNSEGDATLDAVRVYAENSMSWTTGAVSGNDLCLFSDLRDQDSNIRMQALRELDRVSVPERLEVLTLVMRQETDPRIRGDAIAALGRLRDVRALPILDSALTDGDALVRKRAVRALARIGGEKSTVRLGTVLLDGTERSTRVIAARYLAGRDNSTARSYLKVAAVDADPVVRNIASRSLER
jgi:hypothetical protein